MNVDFDLDTWSLVLLRPGSNALDEPTVTRLQKEHVAYNFGLKAAGHLEAAGAITGAESLVGLGFSSLPAERLAELTVEDPGVRAGLYTVDLVKYLCPKGMITFPEAPWTTR